MVEDGEYADRTRGRDSVVAEQDAQRLRELAFALQDVLLPAGLPVIPGLATSGSYLHAQPAVVTGGDWLDVVPVGTESVALVVGDVVGHGVEAAAVMGQLRAICGERLAGGDGVAGSLQALDRFAHGSGGAHAATLTVLELDLGSGDLSYCTAGHPPPLVLDHGVGRFMPPTGGGPLGTGSDFPIMSGRLERSEMLLLYSNGIIERPAREPARATVELSRVAGQASLQDSARADGQWPVDRVCRESLESLTSATGYSDDIALLAAQRAPPLEPMAMKTEADTAAVGRVRSRLAQWLAALRPAAVDEMALQHAVGEVVANVVEHAYAAPAGGAARQRTGRPLDVSARLLTDGTAEVRVEDLGHWRPGTQAQSRGLAVVTGLMDRVQIDRHADHTTVTMGLRLTRALTVLEGRRGPGPAIEPATPFSASFEGSVLRLGGVVDLAVVEDLRTALLLHVNRIGVEAFVDLGAVVLLSSAAVQVLFEVRDVCTAQGIALRLVSPQGSVAQHVLDLVRLPREEPPGFDELPGWPLG